MPYVDYEKAGAIVIVRLNRPERLNALSDSLIEGLSEAMQKFESDDNARVAILTGTGRAFSAGRDIKEIVERGKETRLAHPDMFGVLKVAKPIISAINGLCYGGAVHLMMHTDIRIAAEHATFCMGEIKVGTFGAVNEFFAQGVPLCIAIELGFGEVLSAQRACQAGMINYVVPPDKLMPTAESVAERIADLSLPLVKLTKRTLRDMAAATQETAFISLQILEQFASFSDGRGRAKIFAQKNSAGSEDQGKPLQRGKQR